MFLPGPLHSPSVIIRHVSAGIACAALATPVAAQWAGAIGVVSDYRYRGISRSDRQPAVQASLGYDHASGAFAGVQGSTLRLAHRGEEIGFEVLGYAGYARAVGPLGAWDVGVMRYEYPESANARTYAYNETFLGASYGGASLRLFYSPDYVAIRARSFYAQGAYVHALFDTTSVYAQLGALWLADRHAGEALASSHTRTDVRLGLQHTWRSLQFDVSVVATEPADGDCPRGARLCRPGIVLGISYPFFP